MAWWVLTFLKHYPGRLQLIVRARTNVVAYPYLTASYHKPIKESIRKKVRGTWRFCGYKYTWHKAKIFTHLQTGESWNHTYQLLNLEPGRVIWYYIWSPGGPYGRECQGPLCHALIPRRMIGARVTRLAPFYLHPGVTELIEWDTEYYDDAHFWEPAPNPERLTIPVPGFYQVGFHVGVGFGPIDRYEVNIQDNTRGIIAQASALINQDAPYPWGINALTYAYFEADEFLEVYIKTKGIGDAPLLQYGYASPVFWIISL